jgi:Protein of unknown function (DUF2947)
METKYISFDEFSLNWRFTEVEYNILPEEDLNKIRPLSPQKSKECWKFWISKKVGHFMKLSVSGEGSTQLCNNCGWGEVEREKNTIILLNESLKIDEGQSITFFWNESNAVETTWGIFLKYWTDFCYPSDDSNIIIIHDCEKAVVYVGDKITIVDREKYFSR